MDDNKIIELFNNSGRCINVAVRNDIEIKDYLDKRYSDIPIDKFSYKEVIYRIIHHIDNRPICRVCGNPVNFVGNDSVEKIGKTINGYRKTCCNKCSYKDPLRNLKFINTKAKRSDYLKELEKIKRTQTNEIKFGCANPFLSKDILNKIKNTMILKYGGYTLQSELLKKKVELTNIDRYRVKNVFQSEDIKNKIILLNEKKYGVPYFSLTVEARKNLSIKNKLNNKLRQQTNLSRYGVSALLLNKDIAEKRRLTLRKNKTFKISKEEQLLFELLNELYPELVILQYKSEKYPFNCDFYIKTLLLYIEYNGAYFHQGHVFNENNIDDILKLLELSNKHYNEVIKIWSKSDIEKIKIAKENGLNYLVLYPGWDNNWKTYIKTKYKDSYKSLLISRLYDIIYNMKSNFVNIVGEK